MEIIKCIESEDKSFYDLTINADPMLLDLVKRGTYFDDIRVASRNMESDKKYGTHEIKIGDVYYCKTSNFVLTLIPGIVNTWMPQSDIIYFIQTANQINATLASFRALTGVTPGNDKTNPGMDLSGTECVAKYPQTSNNNNKSEAPVINPCESGSHYLSVNKARSRFIMDMDFYWFVKHSDPDLLRDGTHTIGSHSYSSYVSTYVEIKSHSHDKMILRVEKDDDYDSGDYLFNQLAKLLTAFRRETEMDYY